MRMKQPEIYDYPRQLLEAHGDMAVVEVAQKARSFEEKGEIEEAEDWRGIEAALNAGTTRKLRQRQSNRRQDGKSNTIEDQTESGEKILTFDIPDEALEQTASTDRQAFTWIYCTGAWQYCPA